MRLYIFATLFSQTRPQTINVYIFLKERWNLEKYNKWITVLKERMEWNNEIYFAQNKDDQIKWKKNFVHIRLVSWNAILAYHTDIRFVFFSQHSLTNLISVCIFFIFNKMYWVKERSQRLQQLMQPHSLHFYFFRSVFVQLC